MSRVAYRAVERENPGRIIDMVSHLNYREFLEELHSAVLNKSNEPRRALQENGEG